MHFSRLHALVITYYTVSLLFCFDANSQVSRIWDYSFNPQNNLEASGSSIVALPSGKTITGGIYKNSNVSVNKNTLILVDDAGVLIAADTSTIGSGFKKVIYDGQSNVLAMATLQDDSLPINKIIVARFDTTFSIQQFLIPDTTLTSPGYQTLDMALSSTGQIIVASNWDAFPLICLSVMCMDTTGHVLWERVDSSFQFSYDVKLIADSSGGVFAAGSGRDTSTSEDYIFVTHFTSTGIRDWTFTYYSPAHFFADMTDFVRDIYGNLYISGNVMDTTGQVGCLIKADSSGNVLWNKQVMPLAYTKIITDHSGNTYGATVPLNGVDVFIIDKRDSSGTIVNTSTFQLPGYFASELNDLKLLDGGLIAATGGIFVQSFPKSDLYMTILDTSLNYQGYDIYDSLNFLGETGRELIQSVDGSIYVCGRIRYENQLETCNIGVVKYDISGIVQLSETETNPDFKIYPNPSTGNFRIINTNPEYGDLSISIFDNSGTEVFHNIKIRRADETNYYLNLSPGFYFVAVESEGKRIVQKLVILD